MIDAIRNILFESSLGVYVPFLLGILIIISVQNFFFYFSYKDKAFLWYATYAITIFFDQILIMFGEHIGNYFDIGTSFLYSSLHPAIQWLYNSAYLIFVLQFGDIFLVAQKSAKKIKHIVYLSIAVMLLVFVVDIILNIGLVGKVLFFVQMPIFLVLAVFVYYFLFQIKSKIKYLIIPGSLIYIVFALAATIYSMISDNGGYTIGWIIFYVGIFLENLFFSLGLIVKQKIVLKERNQSQEELIIQLNKNEELKNRLNKELQEDVAQKTSEIISLNKKAEEERIKQLEANYKKKIAELKVTSLQSQMNPHFIFNSLNSINLHIIKNDKENAVNYINKFSKLMRKILTASRKIEVSLQEELETAELYIRIENIRFKNTIDFNLEIEENLNLSTIKIPPLILQPFIENALWHGLSPKKGDKKLYIKVWKESTDFISISIKDNGIGREKAGEIKSKKIHKKTSIGIKLTKERLVTFSDKYQTKHHLTFTDLKENGKPTGTIVTINLPICLFSGDES